MMKKLGKILLVLFNVIILDTPFISGQDKYPKPLPEVNLENVLKSAAIPEHDSVQDPIVEGIIDQINLDSLLSYVRVLTGEDSVRINDSIVWIQHRIDYLDNDLAASYIRNKLESYNLEVYDQPFNEEGLNIIGVQYGILYPEQQYIICAHYDAVANYCADDNASGVAAVLEAARILSRYDLEYTLVYALWDQEEIGLVGSSYYASQARANNTDILGVVNMDMIGWDGDGDRLVDIHSSNIANSDSLAKLLVINNSVYDLNLNPVVYNPGTGASDHSSFWNTGYGAILLIEAYYGEDLNPYYHSEEDRIEKFDYPYFHDMSRLAIGSISSMVQFSEDTLIVVLDPAFGYQKYAAEITIRGAHTHFLDQPETIEVWLSKDLETITADSLAVKSNSLLIAYLDIPLEASKGFWDLNVQTSTEGILKDESSFQILLSPPIISLSPDTLSISVQQGTLKAFHFTIGNVGDNILNYRILNQGQNYSLLFDGVDDQVKFGNNSILDITGELTLSVWYKTETTDWGVLVANYNQFRPDNGYIISSGGWLEVGGNVSFECANNDLRNRFISNTSFSDGKWHFATGTYTSDGSSRGKVFVDAIEQEGYFWSEDPPLASIGVTPHHPLVFGTTSESGPGDPAYFEGIIDEVRIWERALTQEEIQENMLKNLTGSEDGLVGYWSFNEMGVDSVFDLTANRNNGMLQGGVERISDGAPIPSQWLSIESDSGECNPQNSLDIEILVDASELEAGVYYSKIFLLSDDPFTPVTAIPVVLIVNATPGNVESQEQIDFSLYPNPVHDVLNIESQYRSNYSVACKSLNGQIILEQESKGPIHQLDLSSFQKGVYFITIRSKDFVTTRKIIKL